MAETISVKAVLIDKMSADIKKTQETVTKSFGKMQKSADNTTTSMQALTAASMAVKTAMFGIGAIVGGKLVQAFYRVGVEMENLTTEFKVLLGSQGAAIARMKELEEFARLTPFRLDEVGKASKILETFTKGALSTGDGLRMVGDAAAITGEKDFANLAMWVGRAYDALQSNRPVGEALMRLQELALVSGDTRGQIEKLQGAGRGKEAWLVLQDQLLKAKGGMENLSKAAAGLNSTLIDTLQAAMRKTLDGGLWEDYKRAVKGVTDTFAGLANSGALEKIGVGLSLLLNPVKALEINIHGMVLVVSKGIGAILNIVQKGVDGVKDITENLARTPGAIGEHFQKQYESLVNVSQKIMALRMEMVAAAKTARDSIQGLGGNKEAAEGGAAEGITNKKVEYQEIQNTKELERRQKHIDAMLEQDEAFAQKQAQRELANMARDEKAENARVRNVMQGTDEIVAQYLREKNADEMRVRATEHGVLQMIRASNDAIGAMDNNSKKSQKTLAALSFMESLAASAVAVRQIWQDPSTGNTFSKVAMSAAIVIAQLAQAVSLSNTIKGQQFADGGIVQGSSTHGDRIGVRVNAGEMILNSQQQSQLFQMINSGGGSGGVTVTMNNTFPEGTTKEDLEGFSVAIKKRFVNMYREVKMEGRI